MQKSVVASMRQNAGKTSITIGMARVLDRKTAYIKPLGDRVIYRDKTIWDYDAALMKGVLSLDENEQDMSLGHHHSKLRLEKPDDVKNALNILVKKHEDKDILFIEGGRDISYGMSVGLDVFSIARLTGGKLLVVLSGSLGTILDDATFLKKEIDLEGINFAGVILNKVQNVEEFQKSHLEMLENMGLPVLGIIPHYDLLDQVTVEYLKESINAHVIAGLRNLGNTIKQIFVGAMSMNTVLLSPKFKQEGKLIITSGDRSDMIIAAIETDTAAIVLTNNIMPPPNIVSRAEEKGVPLLLLPEDTFKVTKMIDDMETLFKSNEKRKIDLLSEMVKKNVSLDKLF